MEDENKRAGAMGEGHQQGEGEGLGFDDLPAEVQCGVFAQLEVQELARVARVSQSWRQVAHTDSLWLHHLRQRYPSTDNSRWGKWKGDMAASWREVFERRHTLEKKWGKQPHIRSVNAHQTLLRALQYDDDLCVTCSDFGQQMAISFWDTKKLLADDFVSNGTEDDPHVFPYHRGTVSIREVLALQFERTSDLLVHSADRSLQFRRLSSPDRVLSDFEAHDNIIWTLQYEGNTLISGSRDHTIKIWDMETSTKTDTLNGHTRDVRYLRFRGNTVVSTGDDSSVRVWDLRQRQEVAHLQTDSANGWACQFDEEKIVSNGANEVRLWDFRTLEMRQTFKAADSIRFLRYDDTKLVAGCQGNIVEVWNLEGEHINSINVAGGHSGGMTGVLTFQYDERWLFAGLHSRSSENTLVVLDFANPAPASEEPSCVE